MTTNRNHNEEVKHLDSVLDYTKDEDGVSQILCSKEKKMKLAILTLVTIIIIATEIFYREPLFNASVKFEENIHKTYDKNAFIFKLAKLLSDLPALSIVLGLIIIYNFCNILKSFVFLICLYSTFLVVGILKMVYQNPRPVWKSDKILNLTTEGGFGNPSGHSFTSMLMFICLYEILVNQNTYFKSKSYVNNVFQGKIIRESEVDIEEISQNRKIAKYSLLALTIILVILVGFSRIVLGVHSFNQVIYGFSLALLTYYLIFQIVFVDLNDYKLFLKMIENVSFAFSSIVYGVIIMVITLVVYGVLSDEDYVQIYLAKIFQLAPTIPDYKVLYNESLMGIFISVSFVGAILGISLEYTISLGSNSIVWVAYNFGIMLDKTLVMGNSNIRDSSPLVQRNNDPENPSDENRLSKNDNDKEFIWNSTSLWTTFKRTLILLLGCVILCIPTLLIPGTSDLLIVFLFKFAVPLTLVQLYLFYFFKRLIKVLGFSNEVIDEKIRQ